MIENRCGDCRWYEPTRNPDTGRVLTSKDGRCVYTVSWPVLPKAFRGAHFPYRGPCWANSFDPCATWEEKQEKKPTAPKQEDMLK